MSYWSVVGLRTSSMEFGEPTDGTLEPACGTLQDAAGGCNAGGERFAGERKSSGDCGATTAATRPVTGRAFGAVLDGLALGIKGTGARNVSNWPAAVVTGDERFPTPAETGRIDRKSGGLAA
jgi:hypothetical protein